MPWQLEPPVPGRPRGVTGYPTLACHRVQRAGDPGSAALRYQQEGDADVLSWREGLWLATLGGAEALGWQVGRWASSAAPIGMLRVPPSWLAAAASGHRLHLG